MNNFEMLTLLRHVIFTATDATLLNIAQVTLIAAGKFWCLPFELQAETSQRSTGVASARVYDGISRFFLGSAKEAHLGKKIKFTYFRVSQCICVCLCCDFFFFLHPDPSGSALAFCHLASHIRCVQITLSQPQLCIATGLPSHR